MVSTAQTPDSALPHLEATQQAGQSQTSSDSAVSNNGDRSSKQASNQESTRRTLNHSPTLRFVVAGACAVAALGALIVVAVRPGEQPLSLLLLVSATLASSIIITEAVTSWIIRPRAHSIFDPLPLVGCLLIVAAAVTATVTTPQQSISAMVITAPLLAVAAMCVGNGFSLLGMNAARADTDYLFPGTVERAKYTRLGETISLNAGDLVPVDGRIEAGSVGVDERALSPVSQFRIREEQEVVYAGTEVLAGSATLTALSTAQDSCLAQLQRVVAPIVEEAKEGLKVEDAKAATWSAFAIVFFAAASAISWGERAHDNSSPLLSAGTVLLLASICQVAGYLYGRRRALIRDWLARGFLLGFPSSVKDLASITHVECDPSRCSSLSRARVTRLEILDDRLDENALCGFLVSLLGRAEDRVLLAAAQYCRNHAQKLALDRVLELHEYTGKGICGVVHGIELSVGSEDFLLERGIMMQPSEGCSEGANDDDAQILVAIDDDVVARFWVTMSEEQLCSGEPGGDFAAGVQIRVSSGAARDLGPDTLLIRGKESDLIGQTAQREVSLFSPTEDTLRRSTLIAFTPEVTPIGGLLRDCQTHTRAVDRLRLLTGFSGLVTLAATFTGAFTPLIPLTCVLLTGLVVRSSLGK